jgi:hypothetical protein
MLRGSDVEVVLEAMHTDDENVRMLPFPITESLALKLDDQRQKLDQVSPKLPGKARYQLAREQGCFAAVAKGAKDRELKPDRIFIPHSEIANGNGHVRISALKASLTIPDGLHVKSLTFVRSTDKWTGHIEVKESAAKQAANTEEF